MEIKKFNKIDKKSLLNWFENEISNDREYNFLKKVANDCNRGRSTLYLMELNLQKVGLISLSFDRIKDYPCISIEYLFVSKSFRKKKLKELDNKKVSETLIAFVVEKIAPLIKEYIKVKYLALYPDMQSEKLVKYYLEMLPNAFKLKEEEIWILLKI